MQRIVTEEEWNSQYQAGFIKGLERGPHALTPREYNRVIRDLCQFLGEHGFPTLKYLDNIKVILDSLNPADPPDPELDQ